MQDNDLPYDDVREAGEEILQFCHGYEMPFHDVARQYAILIKKSGFRVLTVFLTGKKNDAIAQEVESDEVIFLEHRSRDIRGLKLKQIQQLRDICSNRNIKLCIAHRYKPLYIAAHIPKLHVIGVHHAFGGYQRWTRRFFVQHRQHRISLLGVSDAVRDDIRRSLKGFPERKIQTLHNHIDISTCRSVLLPREKARLELNLPQNTYIFGNCGRLHPDKDQSTLLKAFAQLHEGLPDALLVIMGKGRLERTLKEQARQLAIEQRVIFTGVVPDANRYFKAFDSFVLSSDHEPFGMVLLEAMVAGIPMVVSESGGAPEVCGDSGFMFPLGDVYNLARQMLTVAKLGENQIEQLKNDMACRVESRFSATSAQKQFMNIPFVRELFRNVCNESTVTCSG